MPMGSNKTDRVPPQSIRGKQMMSSVLNTRWHLWPNFTSKNFRSSIIIYYSNFPANSGDCCPPSIMSLIRLWGIPHNHSIFSCQVRLTSSRYYQTRYLALSCGLVCPYRFREMGTFRVQVTTGGSFALCFWTSLDHFEWEMASIKSFNCQVRLDGIESILLTRYLAHSVMTSSSMFMWSRPCRYRSHEIGAFRVQVSTGGCTVVLKFFWVLWIRSGPQKTFSRYNGAQSAILRTFVEVGQASRSPNLRDGTFPDVLVIPHYMYYIWLMYEVYILST
jgi:hypothetical protein